MPHEVYKDTNETDNCLVHIFYSLRSNPQRGDFDYESHPRSRDEIIADARDVVRLIRSESESSTDCDRWPTINRPTVSEFNELYTHINSYTVEKTSADDPKYHDILEHTWCEWIGHKSEQSPYNKSEVRPMLVGDIIFVGGNAWLCCPSSWNHLPHVSADTRVKKK